MIYTYVEGHYQNMTVSPCLDMATFLMGAYLCQKQSLHTGTVLSVCGGLHDVIPRSTHREQRLSHRTVLSN
jgi:hypothetical protein